VQNKLRFFLLPPFYDLFYFKAVQAKERTVEKAESENGMSRNYGAQFIAVRDSRNRKVRGLWQRSGCFYLQFQIPGERSARRVLLQKKTDSRMPMFLKQWKHAPGYCMTGAMEKPRLSAGASRRSR
jgi:hypothetical protein